MGNESPAATAYMETVLLEQAALVCSWTAFGFSGILRILHYIPYPPLPLQSTPPQQSFGPLGGLGTKGT